MSKPRIDELVKGLDIIARRFLAYKKLSDVYWATSVFLIIYVLLVFIDHFISFNKAYISILEYLTGFIGSTSVVILTGTLLSRINSHIEMSKLFHSQLGDIMRIIREEESIDLVENINVLLGVNQFPLEYIPAMLIPAYISLLIDLCWLKILFIIIFIAIDVLTLYVGISKFNLHIVLENKIFNNTVELTGLDLEMQYKGCVFNILEALLSIVSLSLFLVFKLYKLDNLLNNHIDQHRIFYRELKIKILRKKQTSDNITI
ncbi:MAG: hypothetical protein J7J82_08460 [Staphylothermus sp.]|nr:hypothetical protein [Staphylothermus sp.]